MSEKCQLLDSLKIRRGLMSNFSDVLACYACAAIFICVLLRGFVLPFKDIVFLLYKLSCFRIFFITLILYFSYSDQVDILQIIVLFFTFSFLFLCKKLKNTVEQP